MIALLLSVNAYNFVKAQVYDVKTADPVSISARFIPGKGSKQDSLVVEARILKGWHIYAYVSKDNPFIPSEVKLDLPEGITADLNTPWETSAPSPYPGNPGIFIFEEKAQFRLPIDYSKAKSGVKIKCGLYYQACYATKCFPPKEKLVEISI